ncbi:unnamed protein product [Arctogadus glacialis]
MIQDFMVLDLRDVCSETSWTSGDPRTLLTDGLADVRAGAWHRAVVKPPVLQDSDYNHSCRRVVWEPNRSNDPATGRGGLATGGGRGLPLHTAPAGYQCPSCQGPVFPPPHLASPVADALRDQLASVNWARAGLGLPLIEEPPQADPHDVTDYREWSTYEGREQSEAYPSHAYPPGPSQAPVCEDHPAHEDRGAPHHHEGGGHHHHHEGGGPHHHEGGGHHHHEGGGHHHGAAPPAPEHSGANFTGAGPCDPGPMHTASAPRKVYDARGDAHISVTQIDFDDDKYRRRPTLSWFAQILKNRRGSKRSALSWRQKVFMFLLVGVLAFLTLIIVMAKLGRASAGSDPNLDPLMNPNIRIGKN